MVGGATGSEAIKGSSAPEGHDEGGLPGAELPYQRDGGGGCDCGCDEEGHRDRPAFPPVPVASKEHRGMRDQHQADHARQDARHLHAAELLPEEHEGQHGAHCARTASEKRDGERL